METYEQLKKERQSLVQKIPMYDQLAYDATYMRLDLALAWHKRFRKATNRLREVEYLINNF